MNFVQICASILGNEWSPVLSVTAVCVTLQSMLASCKVYAKFLSLVVVLMSLFFHRRKNGKKSRITALRGFQNLFLLQAHRQ